MGRASDTGIGFSMPAPPPPPISQSRCKLYTYVRSSYDAMTYLFIQSCGPEQTDDACKFAFKCLNARSNWTRAAEEQSGTRQGDIRHEKKQSLGSSIHHEVIDIRTSCKQAPFELHI